MNQPDPSTGAPKPPIPDSGLAGAILVTMFCCLPFGIVAIVKASQVNGAYLAGKYEEAQQLADSARSWTMASAGFGLLIGILYFMAMMSVGM